MALCSVRPGKACGITTLTNFRKLLLHDFAKFGLC